MIYIQKLIAAFACILLSYFFAGSCLAKTLSYDEIKKNDLPLLEMSLQVINCAFLYSNPILLERVSTQQFNETKFDFLANYIGKNKINFNHMTMIACQNFLIDDDPDHFFSVTFSKNLEWGTKDPARNHWRVVDAIENDHGQVKQIFMRLHPLSYSDYFAEFLTYLNNNGLNDRIFKVEIKQAAHLNWRSITPASLRLTLKNIIIQNASYEIEEMIFLTFVNAPLSSRVNASPRTGWLIDDAGSMSDLFDKMNPDYLYVNWATGKIKTNELRLKNENDFPVANIAGFSNEKPNSAPQLGLDIFEQTHPDIINVIDKNSSTPATAIEMKNLKKIEITPRTEKKSSSEVIGNTLPKNNAMQILNVEDEPQPSQNITEKKPAKSSEKESSMEWIWKLFQLD